MSIVNTWPGYECVGEIGSGSFGKVYEIHKKEFGKTFKAALKVIPVPQNEADIKNAYYDGMDEQSVKEYFEGIVQSITDEFALMSELKGHSNIVSYEDHMVIPREEGIGWDVLIRMELLTPLMKWASDHPLSEKSVIKLGCDICHALEVCRVKNIIHRDIKPDNIFVNAYNDYKLGDFGIARTIENTIMMSNLSKKGTYNYMAPEVYYGKPYGVTADIYSLGTVLYYFLNKNRTPFLPLGNTLKHSDREEALSKRMGGAPIPPPVCGSEKLKAVILKAIEHEPSKRYQSANEFFKALESCLEEAGTDATVQINSQEKIDDPDGTQILPVSDGNVEEAEKTEKTEKIDRSDDSQTGKGPANDTKEEPVAKKSWIPVLVVAIIVLLAVLGLLIIIAIFGNKPKEEIKETPGITINRIEETTETSEVTPEVVPEEETEEKYNGNFRLNQPVSYMVVGEQFKFKALQVGARNVDRKSDYIDWDSSDSDIAKVDDGKVTARSKGTVTITGSYDGRKDSCEVTVAELDANNNVVINMSHQSAEFSLNNPVTVDFEMTGDLPDEYTIMWYNLGELSPDGTMLIDCEWGDWNGNKTSLTLSAYNTNEVEGDLLIVVYPTNDNQTVLAKVTLPIKAN